MKIEAKNPRSALNATVLEIDLFRNSTTGKVSYKNELGIIKELEYTPDSSASTTALTASIWANGFKIVGCIKENIILPPNSTLQYTGPLSMCAGKTLTIPTGTILTII